MAVGSPIFVWKTFQYWPLPTPSIVEDRDFALVEIDEGFRSKVVPDTALLGGPCGVQTSNPGVNALMEHVGHGAVVGTGGTARVGTLREWDTPRPGRFRFTGVVQGGDSGSPAQVSATKYAIGVITQAGGRGELLGPTLDLLAQRMPGWELMGATGC